MSTFRSPVILTVLTLLGACVPIREIRTELPHPGASAAATLPEPTALSVDCNVGTATDNENRR